MPALRVIRIPELMRFYLIDLLPIIAACADLYAEDVTVFVC